MSVIVFTGNRPSLARASAIEVFFPGDADGVPQDLLLHCLLPQEALQFPDLGLELLYLRGGYHPVIDFHGDQGLLTHELAPVEELVGVDPVLASHCLEGVPRLLSLLQNGAFFFRCPSAAALDRGDDLDGAHVGSAIRGSHTTRLTPIT